MMPGLLKSAVTPQISCTELTGGGSLLKVSGIWGRRQLGTH